MYSILFRTVFLYILITAMVRAMGKRQVGQLEMSELVTTLLLSQIVSLPIEDPSIPLTHVILPVLLLVSFEIITTYLKGRFNLLKPLLEGRPSILIDRGDIVQEELLRVRITVEELLSEARQQGYADIGDVYYAILEDNGRFSFIPRTARSPATPEVMGVEIGERGCALPLICDGVVDRRLLYRMKKDDAWLDGVLRAEGVKADEVFLLTLDAADKIALTRKEVRR